MPKFVGIENGLRVLANVVLRKGPAYCAYLEAGCCAGDPVNELAEAELDVRDAQRERFLIAIQKGKRSPIAVQDIQFWHGHGSELEWDYWVCN